MTYTLVLLRHGESDWNAKNLFTGWVDVDLSDKGRAEAVRGGEQLKEAGASCPTSCTPRCCAAPSRPRTSRSTRPTGTGSRSARLAAQRAPLRRAPGQGQEADPRAVRRGAVHAVAPLLRRAAAADRRPTTSTRQARRPALRRARRRDAGDRVPQGRRRADDALLGERDPDRPARRPDRLVAAHGNSLRALVKHLDGISDDDIAGLNIPTGMPLVYELDDDFRPVTPGGRYLDPEAAAEAARGRRQPGPLTRAGPAQSATRESSCSSWSSSGRSSSLRYSPVTR